MNLQKKEILNSRMGLNYGSFYGTLYGLMLSSIISLKLR